MSDVIPVNNETPKPKEPKEKVVMQIILLPDGNIKLAGMIQDKVFAYGLLMTALDLVRDYNAPKIVKAPGGLMHFVRNGKK